MKKILAALLITVSVPAFADTAVTRCYPVATNVNHQLIITEKCDTMIMPEFRNFDGRTSYSPNMSAYGVALPDSSVVESAVRGAAMGNLYSRVPFSWVFIR